MSFLTHCELKQKTRQCQEACLERSKFCHVWRRVMIAPSQHRNGYWPLPECGIELQDLHRCTHIHKFWSCNLGEGFYNTFYISPVTLKPKFGCVTASLEVFSTHPRRRGFPDCYMRPKISREANWLLLHPERVPNKTSTFLKLCARLPVLFL
jgi:hypothetical protein